MGGTRGRRSLTRTEVAAVFEVLPDSRARLLFGVCLYTGARLCEALALDLEDVTVAEGGEVRVRPLIVFRRAATKGKRESRALATHPRLAVLVQSYLADRGTAPGPLLLAEGTGPGKAWKNQVQGTAYRLSRTQASRIFRRAFDTAGLRERTGSHSMRKTFAQLLSDAGQPIAVTQTLLGHSDIEVTRQYFTVNDEAAEAAVRSLPSLI